MAQSPASFRKPWRGVEVVGSSPRHKEAPFGFSCIRIAAWNKGKFRPLVLFPSRSQGHAATLKRDNPQEKPRHHLPQVDWLMYLWTRKYLRTCCCMRRKCSKSISNAKRRSPHFGELLYHVTTIQWESKGRGGTNPPILKALGGTSVGFCWNRHKPITWAYKQKGPCRYYDVLNRNGYLV